jgi:SAM-dependent methyltransferase
MKSVYFLISCARSGSTSLTKILSEASNGCCLLEPAPNFNAEARAFFDGRMSNPHEAVADKIAVRIEEKLRTTEVYGEKNVTLSYFVPALHERFKCKFLFLQRDGRDVVRSLMDWHNKKFGTIYRECQDAGTLNAEARRSAGNLPVHLDGSDYSRPRPLPGTELYGEWESLTREEMCAYYWSMANEKTLDHLERLPAQSWLKLDYTSPKAEAIAKAADFVGLKGLSLARIEEMLGKKINSLKDRGVDDADVYPAWRHWDGGARRRFTRLAQETMRRLGYFHGKRTDWKPAGYGKHWDAQGGDYKWYEWMHQHRAAIHQDFFDWVAQRDRAGDAIQSIADFGCGLGIGYAEHFAAKRYLGIDLSAKNIDWCRTQRSNPLHRYESFDFLETPLSTPVDVATSSGTIDNCYDVEAFLDAVLQSARKWIYLTCYRGWFPELAEHKYRWDPAHGCFYNDISPQRVREFLRGRGCTNILVEPLRSGKPAIPYETRIVARVSDRPGQH